MHSFYFHRLGLMEPAATDTPGPTTAGGATAPAPAPAGTIKTAINLFRDKAGILGERDKALKDHAELKLSFDKLTADHAAVVRERDGLKAQFKELEDAIVIAQSEKVTLQQAVTHELASTGVPEAKLPKTASATSPELDLDGAIEAMEAESDPQKRGVLAAKVKALRVKAKA